VASREFTAHEITVMLRAIHEREGAWGDVDPNTEVTSIGGDISLNEDESHELFKRLADEGYVDPGRDAGPYHPGRRARR
jgi:hypothetical protein